jgi:hypothetical protein
MKITRIKLPSVDAVTILAILGAGLIVYGVGRIYFPAGSIAAGVLILAEVITTKRGTAAAKPEEEK